MVSVRPEDFFLPLVINSRSLFRGTDGKFFLLSHNYNIEIYLDVPTLNQQ
ncbi:MAG: hypothetical protein SAK42_03485 [Oscillatoria sp. PMC 1076.18]|nr:hypothetical protein [Oscillatoria sp. PMC 1076.18]